MSRCPLPKKEGNNHSSAKIKNNCDITRFVIIFSTKKMTKHHLLLMNCTIIFYIFYSAKM
jgi:hypothetical protein